MSDTLLSPIADPNQIALTVFDPFGRYWYSHRADPPRTTKQRLLPNDFRQSPFAMTLWIAQAARKPLAPGPLCLLRHNGQRSTNKLVRPSGRDDLPEMAVATGP